MQTLFFWFLYLTNLQKKMEVGFLGILLFEDEKYFFYFNSAVIWLLWQFEVVDWRKLNCDLFEAVRNGVLIHSDLQVLALTSVVQQVLNCWWYYILTVEVKGKQELTLRIALIFGGYSFKVSTCQFDLKTGYK